MTSGHTGDRPLVRPLRESDLAAADRIMRVAFGTFNGVPAPETFMGDAGYVHSRWRANPDGAFAAEVDGRLVGSNFATRWGRFGFFGPLTIDPAYWGRGVAGPLIKPVMDCFADWRVTQTGLSTFPHSIKHIGLYQKFGFRPGALILLLEKTGVSHIPGAKAWAAYGDLDTHQRGEILAACRRLTDQVYPGLDTTPEIVSIQDQALGDTILLRDGNNLLGFAACHTGPGSEAGSGTCYMKFAAAVPGHFKNLLSACEAFSASRGIQRLAGGMNAARKEAYEDMLTAGYRLFQTSVSMHRPNAPGFCQSGIFVIDDWR